MRGLFLGLALAGLVAACSGDESPADDGDIFVTTGVGGGATGGSGGAGGSPSTGTWGHHDGGSGQGGSAGHPAPYPIVLAHGFFGFEDFAGLDFATYFYEVKDDLALTLGETEVFTPAVDPFNDSTTRGAQLAAYVDEVLAETGAAKVILIGHSQGGLDARVVAHDHPDKVAAVVTVATPHNGSPVSDIALGITDSGIASDLIDALVNLIGAPLYDQIGNETSVTDALYQFSTPGIAQFNADYPDAPGVFYASITGRTDGHLGGEACLADVDLPYVQTLRTEGDPTEAFLLVSEAICDDGDQPNDGLVRVIDAKHGEFWGCVPADHLDEIGQLFGDNPGLGNPFNHKKLFEALVTEIRHRGF